MAFYGISFSSSYMPGSLYTVLALSSIAELIGFNICFICFIAGRKWPHVIGMVCGGMACVASVIAYQFYEGRCDST